MNNKIPTTCGQENENLTCTNITSQYADVSVPLKLKPYAIVGNLATECCGDPVVTLNQNQNMNCCCGGGYELTITQKICIKIPLEYGSDADIGEATTVCKKNSNCIRSSRI